MKEIMIYVITFNTFSENGPLQVGIKSFTTKKEAEKEAKDMRKYGGHYNVKISKTFLTLKLDLASINRH